LQIKGAKYVPGSYDIVQKVMHLYKFRKKSIAKIEPLIENGIKIIKQAAEGKFDAKANFYSGIFTKEEIEHLYTISTVKNYLDGNDEHLLDDLPRLVEIKEHIESANLRKISYGLIIRRGFVSKSAGADGSEEYSLTKEGVKFLAVLNENKKILDDCDRFVRNLLRDIQQNKKIKYRHLLDV